MSVKENKAVVRRWHDEVWSGWNVDIVDEVLHPDYVRHPSMEGVEATKQRLAEMASKYPDGQTVTEDTIVQNALVLGMHFPPFPCLGHIVDTGQGYQWQPVKTLG